jgi:PAS domain S-box-containing protein
MARNTGYPAFRHHGLGDPVEPLRERLVGGGLFPPDFRRLTITAAELAAIAILYFVLAKASLALASIHPSATPIWPPTGFALAVVLLFGYRVWPAIFVAALVTNATTAGSFATSIAIAGGNTLEALVGGYLINRWSGGRLTFATPARVARFALISLGPSTMTSATIGLLSLSIAGFAPWAAFPSIWMTWWLGDFAGALVIAPVIVLWASVDPKSIRRDKVRRTAGVLAVALAVGLIAFSPLLDHIPNRAPLGFLAILPLMGAALWRGPRDTATVALILSGFAVWGTLAGGGPFAGATLNQSFLLLLMFMISTSLPSLALSADAAVRRQTEDNLRRAHEELDERIKVRTATLGQTSLALQVEGEQRRRAEAELEQERTHLLEAQRLANLGSWVWDVAQGKVTWSQQLYEIYGVQPGEFLGTVDDFLGRIHSEDRDWVKERIGEALQSGYGFRLNERIVRPSGEIRYLQSSGEVITDGQGKAVRMLGVCQDVTQRRQAEIALRETEQSYRLLIEGVRDHAIFMLDPAGRVVNWNTGAARLNQYQESEIVGHGIGRFYDQEDRARGEHERALRTAAAEGKYEAEGWRVRKDGSRYWASSIVNAIRNETGALVGFAKITRDITETREARAALERAREQLAQSQKMEALGQLTGGIAHDFNNLLMIVNGHAEMLRRRISDPKHARALDAIQVASSRGASLTRQLLAFSRRQRLNPAVLDLRERIAAMRDMLGSSLRGDIALSFDIADEVWPIEADPAELELTLLNIAVNARDAMPDGGSIMLTAHNVTLSTDAGPGGLEGDFVALAMTDTGTGISPEVKPRIFEPFFTTKAVGKGTGLGLSQVYGFAHQSGGAVTAASDVGRGTTITIYLPRSRAQVPVQAQSDDTPIAASADGTILVVEDNAEVAEVTAALLDQLGYRIVAAQNAADALKRLEEDGPVDLVFTDIVMPGVMNGLALAQEIERRYPRIPVLLTTGYSEMMQATASPFTLVRKPFELKQLERAIREALRPRAA